MQMHPTRKNRRAGRCSMRMCVTVPWRCSTAAWQAEVAAYIDACAGKVDENGYRLVVRNGYHGEREVLTAAGSPSRPRVCPRRRSPG